MENKNLKRGPLKLYNVIDLKIRLSLSSSETLK